MTTLAGTLQQVRQRIQRSGEGRLDGQNMKATLIEAVLRALLAPRVEDSGYGLATGHDG